MRQQQRVERDEPIALEKLLSAHCLRMPIKEPAFGVGDDKLATTKTRLPHPVLGLKAFDERFLLQDERRREHDDHRLSQHRRLHRVASLPQGRSIKLARPGPISGQYGLAAWTTRLLRRGAGRIYSAVTVLAAAQ